MRKLNNNGIAVLILINILVCMGIFMALFPSSDKDNSKQDPTYVQKSLEVHESELYNDKAFTDDIIYSIKESDKKLASNSNIELYFNEFTSEGARFTYSKTSNPDELSDGGWFIDYDTLRDSDIEFNSLAYNDIIKTVYSPKDEGYEYFQEKKDSLVNASASNR